MPELNNFKIQRTQFNESEVRELKFISVKLRGRNLHFNLY